MPPRSASRTSDPHFGRAGFTLLELLVVMFVVAIMAGVTVIQLGSRDRNVELETEAMRLAHLLELARNEAILGARELALELTGDGDGYGFLELDPQTGRWEVLDGKPWGARSLEQGISIRLRVEDRSRGPEALGTAREGRRPALLILSSGEFTPFRLDLTADWQASPWRLSSDGFGPVSAERVES